MAEITAVILAGGIGKRFVPFITDKTLFSFLGKSLLDRTLEMVSEAGIKNVVLAVNRYNQPWVEGAKNRFAALNIQTALQTEPKGMGDALLSIKHLLPEKDIVVMNAGDMVEHRLLSELLAFAEGKYAVLTGMRTASYQPLGYFVLDSDQRVSGILEKPGAGQMPSDLANLVFHYFSNAAEFVALVEAAQSNAASGSDDVYEQALNQLMRQQRVDVFRYEGPWQKLKYGHHVLDMVEYMLRTLRRSISPQSEIAPSAVVNGEVVIEAGAKILDGAVIQGPCYIGPNAVIGNQALVRQSLVEGGSVVGFASEIVRSYVGANCDLHHAYVGDSVLEGKVHFGYNAHTANYRFDQKPVAMKWTSGKIETEKTKLGALIASGSEIGVNSSILPGICIGTEAFVYPSCLVFAAVPDRSSVKETRVQSIEARTA
jgi:bifunctional UDP-N-acetylglucosamine pyrophosphorylase/glucosamine-1-phosphate N-acetyltransferase